MAEQQGGLNAPVQQPASEGQAPQPAAGKGQFGTRPDAKAAPQSETVFHSYKHDDGEELKFKTPDELNKYIREGTLRHKDYTKKTQEAAELRKQNEKQREETETRAQYAMRMEGTWKPVDDWLKTRPDVVKYIKEQMGQASPGTLLEQSRGIVDESLSPLKSELEELKSWKQQQEQERQFQEHLTALKGQYADFDEEAVKGMYRQIDEAPEGDEVRQLLDILHWAAIGKKSTETIRPPVTPGVRHAPGPSQMPFKVGDLHAMEKARAAGRRALQR